MIHWQELFQEAELQQIVAVVADCSISQLLGCLLSWGIWGNILKGSDNVFPQYLLELGRLQWSYVPKVEQKYEESEYTHEGCFERFLLLL